MLSRSDRYIHLLMHSIPMHLGNNGKRSESVLHSGSLWWQPGSTRTQAFSQCRGKSAGWSDSSTPFSHRLGLPRELRHEIFDAYEQAVSEHVVNFFCGQRWADAITGRDRCTPACIISDATAQRLRQAIAWQPSFRIWGFLLAIPNFNNCLRKALAWLHFLRGA